MTTVPKLSNKIEDLSCEKLCQKSLIPYPEDSHNKCFLEDSMSSVSLLYQLPIQMSGIQQYKNNVYQFGSVKTIP